METGRAEQGDVKSFPHFGEIFLTSKQTRARVGGVSAMSIWRWTRDPRVEFPRPIKINARNYWRASDIQKWQTKRAGEQAA